MRYRVVDKSQSGHCCFAWTVIDTDQPLSYNGNRLYCDAEGNPQYEAVCECFDADDAHLICRVLNAEGGEDE